jgi:hypothetical protein
MQRSCVKDSERSLRRSEHASDTTVQVEAWGPPRQPMRARQECYAARRGLYKRFGKHDVRVAARDEALDDLLQPVRRTPHPQGTTIEHVRVLHRRPHIRVTQQLLHRTNVRARLQQVRRKRMPKRMARHTFGQAG